MNMNKLMNINEAESKACVWMWVCRYVYTYIHHVIVSVSHYTGVRRHMHTVIIPASWQSYRSVYIPLFIFLMQLKNDQSQL